MRYPVFPYPCQHFIICLLDYCLPVCMHAKLLQSCLILCDPMDCSLPGSSVLGILQARILEWVAMPSSRGSSDSGIEFMSPVAPELPS